MIFSKELDSFLRISNINTIVLTDELEIERPSSFRVYRITSIIKPSNQSFRDLQEVFVNFVDIAF